MSPPTHSAENDALRLCCCHGHLDGLTLDEMAAIGAPCPTAAYVRERMAEAYDDGYDACVSDGTPQLHNGNPYRDDDVDPRVIPPGSRRAADDVATPIGHEKAPPSPEGREG